MVLALLKEPMSRPQLCRKGYGLVNVLLHDS
jgi:hypothetical protein